jgi:putative ATP-binding cassette transporter
MADSAENETPPPAAATRIDRALVPQAMVLYRAFMASPERNALFVLGAALVVVIAATAFAQLKLNAWNQPFYDALSHRDLGEFGRQLLVFLVIAGALLILNVVQIWLNRMTKVKLREGLTRDLIEQWLKPGRAFRLGTAGEIGMNPDQRIHEDAQHITELSTDLALGLLQSTLLLLTFIGVLWSLSSGVVFNYAGHSFSIPGYMVWSALAYALTASVLSWLIGRPLVRYNAERYAREADLRFALVQANVRTDSIALYGGEEAEKQRLNARLDDVLLMMRRIVGATWRLTTITAGYGWFTIIAPIIVAAPAYFGGSLSFGGLIMAVGAFNQVQSSLRWFVDNFSNIADWRAMLLRIASFRQALSAMDDLDTAGTSQIAYVASAGRLTFDDFAVATPTRCVRLAERHAEITPGEHVLIVGDPGTEKTTVFHAIAGLWPWGTGQIGLPPRDSMAFMPRRPHVPQGPLREALSYPAPSDRFTDKAMAAALNRAGLRRLVRDLDRSASWQAELTDTEQHLLAAARIALRRPQWVVIDQALDALDDDSRELFLGVFVEDLVETAVVNIGRGLARDQCFTRVLHLRRDPAGPCLATRRPGQRSEREPPERAAIAETVP